MALLTTTIGAYPKPEYVTIPDWFRNPEGPDASHPTRGWAESMEALGDTAEAMFARAAREVLEDQVSAGIDIPTDGEVRRENYIHYHCRHLNGISFEQLTERELRCGAYRSLLPTITGRVSARESFLTHDWKVAQACTDKAVKVTMPGPMTMMDTTADDYYDDPKRLGADIAQALNKEVRALADAGCPHIQIDEPVFVRKRAEALEFGVENLERAFHRCTKQAVRTVHICCSYPDRLDNPDYPKGPPESYFELAEALDRSSIMAVSLEDAHRPNDLSLLELFERTTVIFGVVAIASSRVETAEEIRTRLIAALGHIDSERLIAAPDCGLGLLGRDLALEKLRNLCEAARSVG